MRLPDVAQARLDISTRKAWLRVAFLSEIHVFGCHCMHVLMYPCLAFLPTKYKDYSVFSGTPSMSIANDIAFCLSMAHARVFSFKNAGCRVSARRGSLAGAPLSDGLGETCTSRARATSCHLCEGNHIASPEDGLFRTGTAHAVGLSVSCAGSKHEGLRRCRVDANNASCQVRVRANMQACRLFHVRCFVMKADTHMHR